VVVLRLLDEIEVGLEKALDKERQRLAGFLCGRHQGEDKELGLDAVSPGEGIVLALFVALCLDADPLLTNLLVDTCSPREPAGLVSCCAAAQANLDALLL
jgi:hypothetical protein